MRVVPLVALLMALGALQAGLDGTMAAEPDLAGEPATASPSVSLAAPADTAALAAVAPAEPDDYRTDNYRAPVPLTLTGARVLSAAGVNALQAAGAVLVDVYPRPPKPDNLPTGTIWRDPVHETIENAVWLPNVGYGALAPAPAAYFERHLAALSGGNRGKPMVFFCLRNCWMSWNAGRRALALGYTGVVWFPEGTDGWREAGLPVTAAEPLP